MRWYFDAGHVDRLWWTGTLAMLADGVAKGSVDREALIQVCEKGHLADHWHQPSEQPAQ